MNHITLIGNLTRDPESKTLGSGTTVCNFTIAVNRKYKDANGEKQTDFFDIVAWRALGELCGKWLAKGRKVCVSGELQSRTYEAKDGTNRKVYEVNASDIEFLTPKDGAMPHSDTNGFTQDEKWQNVDDEELPWN
jgi:single-strand DNA-binding protein